MNRVFFSPTPDWKLVQLTLSAALTQCYVDRSGYKCIQWYRSMCLNLGNEAWKRVFPWFQTIPRFSLDITAQKWQFAMVDFMHLRVISQQTVPFHVVITIKVIGGFFFSLCSCKCKVSHRLANHLIQPGLLTLNAGIRCKGKFYDSRLDTKRKQWVTVHLHL